MDARLFTDLAEEIRGFGQQRDWKRNAGEVNRAAWENYAALTVAGTDGLEATDAEIQAMIRNDPSFQQNGGFSFALYQALLRQNGLTPERFEAYLKRRTTLMRVGQAVLASATRSSERLRSATRKSKAKNSEIAIAKTPHTHLLRMSLLN